MSLCFFSACQVYVDDVVEIEIWPSAPGGELEGLKVGEDSGTPPARALGATFPDSWEGIGNDRC